MHTFDFHIFTECHVKLSEIIAGVGKGLSYSGKYRRRHYADIFVYIVNLIISCPSQIAKKEKEIVIAVRPLGWFDEQVRKRGVRSWEL